MQDERFSLQNKLYGELSRCCFPQWAALLRLLCTARPPVNPLVLSAIAPPAGQFFQLYFQRLMLTAPKLKESVAGLWPGVPGVCPPPRSRIPSARRPVAQERLSLPPPRFLSRAPPSGRLAAAKILELDEDVDCVLIGTLYKEMRLKPSILDEYTKDMGAVQARPAATPNASAAPLHPPHRLTPTLTGPLTLCTPLLPQKGVATQVSATKLVSEDDAVVLEDEGARVLLKGDVLRPASLSSGALAAAAPASRPSAAAASQLPAPPPFGRPLPAPLNQPPSDPPYPAQASSSPSAAAPSLGISSSRASASPPPRPRRRSPRRRPPGSGTSRSCPGWTSARRTRCPCSSWRTTCPETSG